MSSPLDILVEAISDVGCWQWWTENLPRTFQVEFAGTQLWNPPTSDDQPPSNQIALRFVNPSSISFLTRGGTNIQTDWPQLLQQDKIKPFTISYDSFTLSSAEIITEAIREAEVVDTVFGSDPRGIEWESIKSKLGFWAGLAGLVIAGEEMEIVSHHGHVELNEIEGMHTRWWDYWNEYWKLKDSSNPLPYDCVCEVTIPSSLE